MEHKTPLTHCQRGRRVGKGSRQKLTDASRLSMTARFETQNAANPLPQKGLGRARIVDKN